MAAMVGLAVSGFLASEIGQEKEYPYSFLQVFKKFSIAALSFNAADSMTPSASTARKLERISASAAVDMDLKPLWSTRSCIISWTI